MVAIIPDQTEDWEDSPPDEEPGEEGESHFGSAMLGSLADSDDGL